ncbi:DEKNAAC100524 [Brettanomyces naardenensis]|uniref:DEKNAAC100524 n=1 Tax=Brettanomyces naardenensis TaxID=13370 RepID=A0A448YG87_BRENA|nr:DEKNAAC100524 [Brettanomyces naardenensis]
MARQNFIGFVVSQGKMDKTIKVRVMQKVFDRVIQKEFLKKKDYLVHDESNICREGDLVRIEATRPLSARKFFSVAEIKKNKGQQFAKYQSEAKLRVEREEDEKSKLFVKRRLANDQLVQNALYEDLDSVKGLQGKNEYSTEELERLKQLKEKYGISSWDEEFENQELFQSDITYLAKKIDDINEKLALTRTLEKVLGNPESQTYKTICQKMGITDSTQKNIKKNLFRKFLRTTPEQELTDLGITLH